MTGDRPTAYDEVSYPGYPLPQTHPAHLAAIARLHGVRAASPATARVLELGCGDGGNLLPLALSYPAGRFVGIDLAPTAIDRAEQFRNELGLANVTFRAADVRDGPADLGEFDYIIAHGLFSWVPEPVRLAVLALGRDRLAPDGGAYISYNARPGGHVRRMLREILQFHVQDIPDPRQKIEQARALVGFLAAAPSKPGTLTEVFQTAVLKGLLDRDPAVLFHDDLAAVNEPYSIADFMALAQDHGLAFLGEADYHELETRSFPPEIASVLDDLGERDFVRREQYRDFLTLRQFRQTLLVRAGRPVVRPAVKAEVRTFSLTADLRTDPAGPDLGPGVVVAFRNAKGAVLSVDHPFAKAVLVHLHRQYPQPVPFDDAIAAAARELDREPTERDREVVTEVLFDAFAVGLADCFVDPPRFAAGPGPRPTASPLARLQVRTGQTTVTSLRHAPVALESMLTRQLVLLLDGTRDRATLGADLIAWARDESHRPSSASMPSPSEVERMVRDQLEEGLRAAARLALLMPE
jgi:SAM-dependent methyltransferase